ncbi:16S rRNA processing protein RimM [Bathymodiolus thermophilus thioautotrophic gill symbiont]|nr:16S rRNA processing protein RimM [Bathymodiolus thermophilus thioautotrophic gill symbiont]
MKIFSYTHPRKNILSYQPWHIDTDGHWQTLEIVTGRVQSKTIVAQIENINDRDQARKLIGTDIYIEKSQLPKLKKDEYYWEELIGLEVINKELVVLGKVSNLVSTGANSVLIVQDKKSKKEHWVPYIKPSLIKVDLDKRQILVDWDENF